MRDFDHLRLAPTLPLYPTQIKRIRETSRVSQAVFAALLNTSVSTVQKWEIGQKRPTGTALKLLHLVQKTACKLSLELPTIRLANEHEHAPVGYFGRKRLLDKT